VGRPRLTPGLLSDTVTGLLWLEDRHRRDVAAINSAVPVAEAEENDGADYPDVIVIDDEDDEHIAV
jgi:hypothetical protein